MQEKTVTIRNKAGIHCRPSSVIMFAAEKFTGTQISIMGPHGSCILMSILDLLSMGLQKGDSVTIQASGPQEEEACEKMAELFEKEFDFV